MAVAAVGGLVAYWATVHSLQWLVRRPRWATYGDWVLVPALCFQLVAAGFVSHAAPPVAGGGPNIPWPASVAWALGLLAIAAEVADRAPQSAAPMGPSCTGYGLLLLVGMTYGVAGVPVWEIFLTLTATAGMLLASLLVRWVREQRVPRAASAILEEFGSRSDDAAAGNPETANVIYPGPDAARRVEWPQWPADPGAWFVEALQEVAGPTGELARPEELARTFEAMTAYGGPMPPGYGQVGALPAGLQRITAYWGRWISRLTCSVAGVSVGALVAASLERQGALALLAWALGLVSLWMIGVVVARSPRLARLSAIAETADLVAQWPDIPAWAVPDPWRGLTADALLAAVPLPMPGKFPCRQCQGSGLGTTKHPVEVLVSEETHTTTQVARGGGEEGWTEVTVHHPEVWRTQWVPDRCPACEGKGHTVSEWPREAVQEHARSVAAWVSSLLSREPSIQEGIRVRNQRLSEARGEVQRWRAAASRTADESMAYEQGG